MRWSVAVAWCFALARPVGVRAQTDTTWQGREHAMAAALAIGDTVAYWSSLNALQHAVGATPRLAARLAATAFAMHDTADGLRWSRALTAMGVDYDTGLVARHAGELGPTILAELRRDGFQASRAAGRPELILRLADPDMVAEDFGYDAARHRYLVSSVRRGAIYAIGIDGKATAFVRPGVAGVWGIFAIGIDPGRNILWATTVALPGTANYTPADSGRSALLAYDLRSGAELKRLVPFDSGSHALGDLTISANGTVYVADGTGGGVYAADPNATTLRPVVPTGTFSSPQTPAVSDDGRRLFVPDYTFGIAVMDLANGHWHWLAHSDSLALTGIDGLYREGRDLIAVQNGFAPNRITRLILGHDDQIQSSRVLIRGGDAVDLNHAMVRGRQLLFIARSGWDRVAEDGTMAPGGKADASVLRRMPIGAMVAPARF
jgi:hypothetical protein